MLAKMIKYLTISTKLHIITARIRDFYDFEIRCEEWTVSYVIILQIITILLCAAYNFRSYIKYVVLCVVIMNAAIASYLFFSQLSNQSSFYIHMSRLFFDCDLGIFSDSLSVTVGWTVALISAIITCFSFGYFTKRLSSFLCRLHAMVLAIMLFICSNNLLQMCISAELVTTSMYFLICFNFKEELSRRLSQFLAANRFGNVLMLFALIFTWHAFKSLSFENLDDVIISNDALLRQNEWITYLLTISILIKTSQICASRWIKTTMEAPLPAAIVIHLAIAINIFIIVRLQNLFEYNELAQNILIVFGLATAVLCSIKALHSKLLSDMLAYSTNSQIGLMVAACGFSAYSSVIIIFITYTFSKLLLFLSVGSVGYALSGETRLENMGGLFEFLPKTYISFIIATISLINIPLLPSYYAKKQFILEVVSENSPMYYSVVFAILVMSIFTCTYLFRMIYLIFHGETHVSEVDIAYINENNSYINISLYASAFFAIFSGVFFYYFVLADVMWKDIFTLTYENYPSAVLAFSIANLAGGIGALFMCKNIKPISFDFVFKVNLSKCAHLFHKVREICVLPHKNICYHGNNKLLLPIFFLLLFLKVLRGV